MGLTRRNAVIGLGALVGGTGALAASGAFTTVEAQRDVSLQAEGDADALLQIEPTEDSQMTNDDGDTLTFDGGDFNLRARTTLEAQFAITNDGTNDVDVDILDDFDGDGGDSLIGSGNIINFSVNSGYDTSDDSVLDHDSDNNAGSNTDVSPGETVVFDFTFDITDDTVANDGAVESVSAPIDSTTDIDDLLGDILPEGADGNEYLVIEAQEST